VNLHVSEFKLKRCLKSDKNFGTVFMMSCISLCMNLERQSLNIYQSESAANVCFCCRRLAVFDIITLKRTDMLVLLCSIYINSLNACIVHVTVE
jgi:hypothetical protein